MSNGSLRFPLQRLRRYTIECTNNLIINKHPFAKGIQGAPGVGFHLTSDGNYDMVKKKLTNVADELTQMMLLKKAI